MFYFNPRAAISQISIPREVAPESAMTAATDNKRRAECRVVPCGHRGAPTETLTALGGKSLCDHWRIEFTNGADNLVRPLRAQPTRAARQWVQGKTGWRRCVFQAWGRVCDQLKNISTTGLSQCCLMNCTKWHSTAQCTYVKLSRAQAIPFQ